MGNRFGRACLGRVPVAIGRGWLLCLDVRVCLGRVPGAIERDRLLCLDARVPVCLARGWLLYLDDVGGPIPGRWPGLDVTAPVDVARGGLLWLDVRRWSLLLGRKQAEIRSEPSRLLDQLVQAFALRLDRAWRVLNWVSLPFTWCTTPFVIQACFGRRHTGASVAVRMPFVKLGQVWYMVDVPLARKTAWVVAWEGASKSRTSAVAWHVAEPVFNLGCSAPFRGSLWPRDLLWLRGIVWLQGIVWLRGIVRFCGSLWSRFLFYPRGVFLALSLSFGCNYLALWSACGPRTRRVTSALIVADPTGPTIWSLPGSGISARSGRVEFLDLGTKSRHVALRRFLKAAEPQGDCRR